MTILMYASWKIQLKDSKSALFLRNKSISPFCLQWDEVLQGWTPESLYSKVGCDILWL